MKQALVVSLIAILMTVGVDGLSALIVKLDDMGLHLIKDVRTSTWSAAVEARAGSWLAGVCAVFDEIARGNRHCRDVSGWRRHPVAWLAIHA